MKRTYASLNEKDRRRFAAIEALKLPKGGQKYIAQLFGCSKNTVARGIREVKNPELIVEGRIRRAGGGRKSSFVLYENIDAIFLEIIDDHIAGDPMRGNVRWTNLSQKEIAARLKQNGIDVGVKVVIQLLARHGFVKRKAVKSKAIGVTKNRNEQFENIAALKNRYLAAGNPVISVDTKKKSS